MLCARIIQYPRAVLLRNTDLLLEQNVLQHTLFPYGLLISMLLVTMCWSINKYICTKYSLRQSCALETCRLGNHLELNKSKSKIKYLLPLVSVYNFTYYIIHISVLNGGKIQYLAANHNLPTRSVSLKTQRIKVETCALLPFKHGSDVAGRRSIDFLPTGDITRFFAHASRMVNSNEAF
jgi:hypothetical protein